jgi:hypothetical protein
MGERTRARYISRGHLFEYEGKEYPEFIQHIPKYALEALYRIYVKPQPDWPRLCRSNISTALSLQAAAERVLKIKIQGDKEQTCAALQGIVTVRSAREQIAEVAPELILQPGGVQYMKYRPLGSVAYQLPTSRNIDISRWYDDINRICNNDDKTSLQAYNLAIGLGLEPYVSDKMTKQEICTVMQRYLQLLNEGRSL